MRRPQATPRDLTQLGLAAFMAARTDAVCRPTCNAFILDPYIRSARTYEQRPEPDTVGRMQLANGQVVASRTGSAMIGDIHVASLGLDTAAYRLLLRTRWPDSALIDIEVFYNGYQEGATTVILHYRAGRWVVARDYYLEI